jgi:hypothetical protein
MKATVTLSLCVPSSWRASFEELRICSGPFDDNKFDFVINNQAMEHAEEVNSVL